MATKEMARAILSAEWNSTQAGSVQGSNQATHRRLKGLIVYRGKATDVRQLPAEAFDEVDEAGLLQATIEKVQRIVTKRRVNGKVISEPEQMQDVLKRWVIPANDSRKILISFWGSQGPGGLRVTTCTPCAMLPVSRKERLRQRLRARQLQEETPALKRPKLETEVFEEPPEATEAIEAEEFVEVTEEDPNEAEEISASTFLAAVKGRLLEWGQVEQYHRFVVALSGSVDVKLATKILRGHDDLLSVFRRKFAPVDSGMMKKEIKEQMEEEEGPKPPAFPPPKADMAQPVGLAGDEDLPRPPAFPPNHVDSDEEALVEASVAAAIERGPQECVRQLVDLLDRVPSAQECRASVLRYALKVVSKPRFPRELYILRGAPGIGKSDFAMERLLEMRALEGQELAGRLSHICAAEDFLSSYRGEEYQLEKALKNNELRALLTMEAGIHPVFIDAPNLRLWEMKPYVLLAERLGYVVNVVEPWEICAKYDDLQFLLSFNDTVQRREGYTALTQQQLQTMLKCFQPSPIEAPEAIRRARPGRRHYLN
eukprot:symbB.v1.2.034180.t1/scaffold4365.1/size40646/2